MNSRHVSQLAVSRQGRVTRRDFLYGVSAGTLATGALGWVDLMALQADELRRRGKACILLWMQGGPSQLETFDPKPGRDNGGPTQAIETAVPGIRIAEHWPRVAQVMDKIALVRSMTNREGNHQRATYQLHTGYAPSGSVKHPNFGSVVACELGEPDAALPQFVSIGPTLGAGLLGTDYDPFVVRNPSRPPDNVALPVADDRFTRRLGLLDRLEKDFAAAGGKNLVADHRSVYHKTARMVRSDKLGAFDLENEPASMRERYGPSAFGQGCLVARRLIEAGVTFVEVRMGGWDTHQDNFNRVADQAGQVDPAFAALVSDLSSRELLDSTLVVWMGEFGRTPRINARTGRDHFPRAFNVVLAGGGIRGGRVIGRTSDDGMEVVERPVTVADLFCSFCHALGIDPRWENLSPFGRPLKIVEGGAPIDELFA